MHHVFCANDSFARSDRWRSLNTTILDPKVISPATGSKTTSFSRKHPSISQGKTMAYICKMGQNIWWDRISLSTNRIPSDNLSGNIIYVHALGQPIIILNGYGAAHELFEKRSAIYSSRPRMVRILPFRICLVSLVPFNRSWQANCTSSPKCRIRLLPYFRMGLNKDIPFMPYGPQFQKMRRLVHKEFTGMALQKYYPLFERESRILARNLLANPEKSSNSIRQYAI
jgi:hypothetical protein